MNQRVSTDLVALLTRFTVRGVLLWLYSLRRPWEFLHLVVVSLWFLSFVVVPFECVYVQLYEASLLLPLVSWLRLLFVAVELRWKLRIERMVNPLHPYLRYYRCLRVVPLVLLLILPE